MFTFSLTLPSVPSSDSEAGSIVDSVLRSDHEGWYLLIIETERLSRDCRKTKTIVFWRGKMRVDDSRLVLVLLPTGRKNGASLTN